MLNAPYWEPSGPGTISRCRKGVPSMKTALAVLTVILTVYAFQLTPVMAANCESAADLESGSCEIVQ